ncbi:hypothetical protein BD779DRAFT_1613535 [Infundibulicybe gibba]|nr:hypothetical protein BD779DRAFT_1613535 [Infundibulicybe gibba]
MKYYYGHLSSQHGFAASAIIYQNFDQLPSNDFDFVIVGGGTAGNVLANRLTENPSFSVLVIEDGPSFSPSWVNNRRLAYPRGHILGEVAPSVNGLFYTRGSSSDFDRFARLQPYIRKNEKWSTPADHHNTTGQFDPSVHGFNGINSVSLIGLPQEFPFNLDMNSGNPLGLGWLQTTIDEHGRRSSSATSYLGPQFINRPNLHVLLETRVTRVLSRRMVQNYLSVLSNSQKDLHAKPRNQVTASKEVIVAAGSIGTPHILLHSGIGDAGELVSVGIKPVLNLPSVGKNLSDQTLIGNSWFVNSTDTLDSLNQNATLLAEALQQWKINMTGPLVSNGASHVAWLRLPDDSPIFKKFADPSAGRNTPHYELAFGNGDSFASVPANFISGSSVVVTPVPRGSVKLNSSDPFEQPLIDPALLNSDFDLFAMREAIKSAKRFFAAPVWKDYGANYGVVGPDLLVKGASGLRIVDASVMPFVTCGHTQAPVYIIAERAADLVKKFWSN